MSKFEFMEKKDSIRLIYVYDPLCGWCYAFHHVLVQIMEEFGHHFALQTFVGGLLVGDRVGPISTTFPQMLDSIEKVESLSGIAFGEKFKKMAKNNPSDYYLDSLPLCQAHLLLRAHNPNIQTEIIGALHEFVYQDSKDVRDLGELASMASRFGMNEDLFLRNMALQTIKEVTEKEFITVTNWGVKAYPFLFALKGTEATVIANGYQDYKNLKSTIELFLDQ